MKGYSLAVKYGCLFVFLFCTSSCMRAQTYADSIQQYRKQYIKDLLAEPRHPVAPSQAGGISFFPPDRSYCVWADFVKTEGSTPFLVPTHSGKQKPFKEYGVLHFYLHDTMYTLHAYQLMNEIDNSANSDELFVMFNDLTNYETTYGGGRYIDLSVKDIKDGKILLDFNKCYNPYCAYADGFSCPIPPSENNLQTAIRAGEKVFNR